MSRNLRNRDHPAPQPVSSYEIAPDYFGAMEDHERDMREYLAETYKEWRDAHPYKPGMIVWVEFTDRVNGEWTKTARKAYISDVFFERDAYGDRRAKYRVHYANKKGNRFANNWSYTYPGYIQRGYKIIRNNA